MLGRITGLTFLPGVLNENSGGGLLGLAGVEVTGFRSLAGFTAGTAGRLLYSDRFSMPAGRGPVARDGLIQSSLKI